MDRFNRLSAIKLLEIQITLCLVALYAKLDLADGRFFEEQSVGLAECAIPSQKSFSTAFAPAPAKLRLIWTVMNKDNR